MPRRAGAAARETFVERGEGGERRDQVAVEEPLEIRIDGEPVVVTMRSPGAEAELALGYLYAEGWIESAADVAGVTADGAVAADVADPADPPAGLPSGRRASGGLPGPGSAAGAPPEATVPGAIVDVQLSAEGRRRARRRADAGERERAFRVTSACGVCGKPSLEDLWVRLPSIPPLDLAPALERQLVRGLPQAMRVRQDLFEDTGGVHAAALFHVVDRNAGLLWLYEDIGRHNAVDKVVGRALQAGRLPLDSTILAVSGRLGFEIVQKAAVAGVPAIAAVGAPSSLALDIAHLAGIRIYAFVAGDRANLYPPAPVEARLVSRAD